MVGGKYIAVGSIISYTLGVLKYFVIKLQYIF